MEILSKTLALLGIVSGIFGTLLVDRGTMAGLQIPAYMDKNTLVEFQRANDRLAGRRRWGLVLIGVGFLLQGLSVVVS